MCKTHTSEKWLRGNTTAYTYTHTHSTDQCVITRSCVKISLVFYCFFCCLSSSFSFQYSNTPPLLLCLTVCDLLIHLMRKRLLFFFSEMLIPYLFIYLCEHKWRSYGFSSFMAKSYLFLKWILYMLSSCKNTYTHNTRIGTW